MKPITVQLKDRPYRIEFGSIRSLPRRIASLKLSISQVLVVTSQAVRQAGHARRLTAALQKNGFRTTLAVLPNGERWKTHDTLRSLYRSAFRAGLDRRSLVVALGGGVVTDLAGFFAATYMRGVPLVSAPTTLLGMVDAAIGGKTGVDLPEGKNLVGAFWQPRLVWIDTEVLQTLPVREWRTGFAEVIKYGVIKDKSFFRWLERRLHENPAVWGWPAPAVRNVVHRSAFLKAVVVARDERETPLAGGREILNFGHTIGHALEAATGYDSLSHGEAISLGMAAVGRMAVQKRWWAETESRRLDAVLKAAGLPVVWPRKITLARARFWSALVKDKKAIGGDLRFVVPTALGRVRVQSGWSKKDVKDAVRSIGLRP